MPFAPHPPDQSTVDANDLGSFWMKPFDYLLSPLAVMPFEFFCL
jgi:hypothetical protein